MNPRKQFWRITIVNRVLVYHKIDYIREIGFNNIKPEQFRFQIKMLKERGYIFKNISQLNDDGEISINFDDSYQCIYRNAFPILQEMNIPATFFVITDYIGRKNMWDVKLSKDRAKHLDDLQIKELIRYGWELGSHTRSHRCLTLLARDELIKEIKLSKEELENRFGVKVRSLSVPFGRLNQRVIELALEFGYEKICGFFPFKYYFNGVNKFIVPRIAVYSVDNIGNIVNKISSDRKRLFFEVLKQNVINFCANGTILTKSIS